MPSNPLHPIPHPPRLPLLGNLLSVRSSRPMQDMAALARQFGPIYWLKMPGVKVIVVTGAELAAEVCDTTRFDKCTIGTLRRLRPLSHGLFTSDTREPTWSQPHGILLPNFSQRAMRGYHPMMLDIAEQLIAKWARLNPDDAVDVVRDMTALTLDTIGLAGFGYRFNSFYREGFHPFVDALTRSLETTQRRRGLPLEHQRLRRELAQQRDDIAYMHGMVEAIVRERRAVLAAGGAAAAELPADLLGAMLEGVDKASGQGLDDRQIRDECIEFLIAGHETTSNLLSFAIAELLRHPAVLARARAEVDEVFGTDPTRPPDYAQVTRLAYVQQVLKETLRLYPPAPAIGLQARADTEIGGADGVRYPVPRRSLVILNALALHRDPAAWGDEPERFDPDRFTREAEAARPVHAYKPFGNGQRACIGRQFALQEATLVLGLVLQRFELVDHTGYQLRIREALTIKPEGLRLRVRERGRGPAAGAAPLAAAGALPAVAPADTARHGPPLLVLHGSNLGSAEDCARQLADSGRARGYDVRQATLDDAAGALPTQGLLLVVSASYNGLPPDNAAAFCDWLDAAPADPALAGLRHAVFGCGNRDWASTWQAVPRRIDDGLAGLGTQRLLPRGEGDARADLDGDFQAWAGALWPAAEAAFGLAPAATAQGGAAPAGWPVVAVQACAADDLPPAAQQAGLLPLTVRVNRELQRAPAGAAAPDRSTRHLELDLPPGHRWQVGDHLALLPRNPDALVQRALARLGLDGECRVRLQTDATRLAHLPPGPTPVRRLLAECVELQAPATRRQIARLAELTRCPHTGAQMAALLAPGAEGAAAFQAQVQVPRASLLDLLERWPACEATLADLLALWPPLVTRRYSVASSPVVAANTCAITVAVVDGPARSGHGRYRGVCSTLLHDAAPGQVLYGHVVPGGQGFTLPADPGTPLVMVGAGSGLAPFRGFLQQRVAQRAAGSPVGQALLFFGCRHPEQDYLYGDELQAWSAQGLVTLRTAFSRLGTDKVYVQHRLLAQAGAVWALLQAGAVVYVCGDGAQMEPAVRDALRQIALRHGADDGWLDRLVGARRYVTDVWAGG